MSGRNLVLELHCLAPGRGGSSSSRSQRAQGGALGRARSHYRATFDIPGRGKRHPRPAPPTSSGGPHSATPTLSARSGGSCASVPCKIVGASLSHGPPHIRHLLRDIYGSENELSRGAVEEEIRLKMFGWDQRPKFSSRESLVRNTCTGLVHVTVRQRALRPDVRLLA